MTALADPEKLREQLARIDHALEHVRHGQLDEGAARDMLAEAADLIESQAAELAELREKLAAAESTIATQADTINAMQAWVDGSGPDRLAAAEAERDRLNVLVARILSAIEQFRSDPTP